MLGEDIRTLNIMITVESLHYGITENLIREVRVHGKVEFDHSGIMKNLITENLLLPVKPDYSETLSGPQKVSQIERFA